MPEEFRTKVLIMDLKGLTITYIRKGKASVYQLEGEINPDIYYDIVDYLKDKVTKKDTIINLEGVQYISSAGVSALLTLNKVSHDAQKQLIICGLTNPAKQILQLTRLYNTFTIVDTEEDAIKRLD